jgi:hypothetical protein
MDELNLDPIIELIHQMNMIIIFDRIELIAKQHRYDLLTLCIRHLNLEKKIFDEKMNSFFDFYLPYASYESTSEFGIFQTDMIESRPPL